MKKHKHIILDRDGVINFDSLDHIKTPDEWIPIPRSIEAIKKLCDEGYQIIIITNQSGIGRKLFSIEMLHAIHKKMNIHLAQYGGVIDGIFFCPCIPEENCNCRKPKPGMLIEAKDKYNISMKDSWMIGDSESDIKAANAAGISNTILVRSGHLIDESNSNSKFTIDSIKQSKEVIKT